jgi:hypothetical protein
LHISDLPVDEKIEILASPETVVATVGFVKEEVVEVAPVDAEGAAEPELIGKKKGDEEGGEPEKAKKE